MILVFLGIFFPMDLQFLAPPLPKLTNVFFKCLLESKTLIAMILFPFQNDS